MYMSVCERMWGRAREIVCVWVGVLCVWVRVC